MTLLYAYAVVKRGRECWSLVIPKCPFCHKRHTHGGGLLSRDPKSYFSSRSPHCANVEKSFLNMYWLTDDGTLHGQAVPESLYSKIGMQP
jgi:hypothetical protein